MERHQYILGVLSTIENATYTPVQIQKILFLLDKNIGEKIGGPYFNFEPYHYGPFDKTIYKDLDILNMVEEIGITRINNVTVYRLTPLGQEKGEKALDNIGSENKDYIKTICSFVKSLSFEQLLKSIYKEYPEMKANSIFHP